MIKKLLNLCLLTLCLLLLANLSIGKLSAADNSILDIASGNEDFSTLTSLINETGLAAMLENNGPFTVFAPSNEAFAAIEDVLGTLSQTQKRQIVLHHIVQGTRSGEQLSGVTSIRTAFGQSVSVGTNAGGNVVIGDSAVVTSADLEASNGIVHIVNAVLIPEGVVPAPASDTANGSSADSGSNASGGDPLTNLFFDPDGPYGDQRVTFEIASLDLTLLPAVRAFNGQDFAAAAVIVAAAAEEMRNMLDGNLSVGIKTLCDDYSALYVLISVAPRFTDAGDAQPLVDRYEAGVTKLLDSNRPFALYCLNDGGFSQINWGLARIGAQDAMDTLTPVASDAVANYGTNAAAEAATETNGASTPPAQTETTDSTTTPDDEGTAPNDAQVAFETDEELEAAVDEAVDRLFFNYDGETVAARTTIEIPDVDEEGILAVPLVAYDNFDFFVAVTFIRTLVGDIGNRVDAITSFNNDNCAEYINLYLYVATAPSFKDVPTNRQGLVDRYETAIAKLIDTNRPFMLYCVNNSSNFSSFNKFLARDGVNQTLQILIPLNTEAGIASFGN